MNRICVQHDELKGIGETFRGNVLVRETNFGLWFEADLGDSFRCQQVARYLSIGRLAHASVSFTNGATRRVREKGVFIDEHISAGRLLDIALTNKPAFPQTAVRLIESASPAIMNRKLRFYKSTLGFSRET